MVVYLDHAATTPLRPEAREAWLDGARGRRQRRRRSTAPASPRARCSRTPASDSPPRSDCDPVEVVFTSGGTESVNLGDHGPLSRASRDHGAHGDRRSRRPSTTRRIDTVDWLQRARGRRRSSGCGSTATRPSISARWEAAVRQRGCRRGDAPGGEQRGRHDAAGRRGIRRCRVEAGVPLHVDAVAAFGHVPLSFRGLRASPARAAPDSSRSASPRTSSAARSASARSSSRARRRSSRSSTAAASSAASARAPRMPPARPRSPSPPSSPWRS